MPEKREITGWVDGEEERGFLLTRLLGNTSQMHHSEILLPTPVLKRSQSLFTLCRSTRKEVLFYSPPREMLLGFSLRLLLLLCLLFSLAQKCPKPPGQVASPPSPPPPRPQFTSSHLPRPPAQGGSKKAPVFQRPLGCCFVPQLDPRKGKFGSVAREVRLKPELAACW